MKKKFSASHDLVVSFRFLVDSFCNRRRVNMTIFVSDLFFKPTMSRAALQWKETVRCYMTFWDSSTFTWYLSALSFQRCTRRKKKTFQFELLFHQNYFRKFCWVLHETWFDQNFEQMKKLKKANSNH